MSELPQSKPRFCVIIPCFNEHLAIEQTVASLSEALKDRGAWELIVVDDGSSDGTSEILDALAQKTPMLKVVRHDVNRGYGAALKSGIRRATSRHIVITDADGTYPVAHIADLLDIAEAEDADMVVGARIGKDVEYSRIRRIPKVFLARYCSWITRYNIPDINSGLRVFKKDILEKYVRLLPDSFSFTTTVTIAFLTSGHKVVYTPVDYRKRVGKSKIRPVRDTLNFVHLIFRSGVYFAPMRTFMPLIAVFGGAFTVSLIYDIVVKYNLTDKTIMLFILFQSTFFFAILADLIDRRGER